MVVPQPKKTHKKKKKKKKHNKPWVRERGGICDLTESYVREGEDTGNQSVTYRVKLIQDVRGH